jgi:hypothetical protein
MSRNLIIIIGYDVNLAGWGRRGASKSRRRVFMIAVTGRRWLVGGGGDSNALHMRKRNVDPCNNITPDTIRQLIAAWLTLLHLFRYDNVEPAE